MTFFGKLLRLGGGLINAKLGIPVFHNSLIDPPQDNGQAAQAAPAIQTASNAAPPFLQNVGKIISPNGKIDINSVVEPYKVGVDSSVTSTLPKNLLLMGGGLIFIVFVMMMMKNNSK